MKFEQLDRRMRVFETAHDHCVLPGIHMVARIDGRSFSHLTREGGGFDAPYDERFRDAMVSTLEHLVTDCGFAVLYGYTQSDELSLLFRREESMFGRKLRKLLSVLAGEASAKFALTLGQHAAFDARISQLPRDEDVVDYFRWRQEDAQRNALNGHAYWLLRQQGKDDRALDRREDPRLVFRVGIERAERVLERVDLLGRPAEPPLALPVPDLQRPVRRERVDHHRRVLEDGPEALLALSSPLRVFSHHRESRRGPTRKQAPRMGPAFGALNPAR